MSEYERPDFGQYNNRRDRACTSDFNGYDLLTALTSAPGDFYFRGLTWLAEIHWDANY